MPPGETPTEENIPQGPNSTKTSLQQTHKSEHPELIDSKVKSHADPALPRPDNENQNLSEVEGKHANPLDPGPK